MELPTYQPTYYIAYLSTYRAAAQPYGAVTFCDATEPPTNGSFRDTSFYLYYSNNLANPTCIHSHTATSFLISPTLRKGGGLLLLTTYRKGLTPTYMYLPTSEIYVALGRFLDRDQSE